MPNKELKKALDYCLNVKECSKCDYAKEEDCMLTCKALIKECLNENYAEVVRCKDCKYSTKDKYHAVSVVCTRFKTGQFTHRMQPMNFCSYGERKEE